MACGRKWFGSLQRFWLISAWSVDQESLLKLYNSINVFDWQKDEFLIYDSNLYDPYPIIGTFLREREMKRMMMPVTRFTIDRKTALNLTISTSKVWSLTTPRLCGITGHTSTAAASKSRWRISSIFHQPDCF